MDKAAVSVIFPEDFEVKLGFDKIKLRLGEFCVTAGGKKLSENLRFTHKASELTKLTGQLREMMALAQAGALFDIPELEDPAPALSRAQLPGAVLSGEEALIIKKLFTGYNFILDGLNGISDTGFEQLKKTAEGHQPDTELPALLNATLDDSGELKDDASPLLKSLRRELNETKMRLRAKLNGILQSARKAGMSPDDSGITLRNGRAVIPVLAEYKRKIKGLVHDESATGQTVYLEPNEAVEDNNQAKELEGAERRETYRLLAQLTDAVRDKLPLLRKASVLLSIMDLIRAKVLLARHFHYQCPDFVHAPLIQWRNARHPLLENKHRTEGRTTVPFSLDLNDKERLLIISGPNAGGKSVLLQAAGLLQYMFQCGLPVPVDEHSVFGVFEKILLDIGDEQSIENELSTYSSHLTALKFFMEQSSPRTLLLLDEPGAGTEPGAGEAVTLAVLERLRRSKALGVLTTHFAGLKAYAEQHEGVLNGSMAFDAQNFNPLFTFMPRLAGRSYALEIAEKTGLPRALIAEAEHLLGREKLELEKLLAETEKERQRHEKLANELEKKTAEAELLRSTYIDLKQRLQDDRKFLMDEARKKALRLLDDSNKKIENTIKTIKESNADKEKTKQARQLLEQQKQKLTSIAAELPAAPPDKKPQALAGEIKTGSYVQLLKSGMPAKVTAIAGDKAELAVGGLKTFAKIKELVLISKKDYELNYGKEMPSGSVYSSIVSGTLDFNSTIDIRGKRAEEVFPLLDRWIDDALLAGVAELRVLHGKGEGVLRSLVRDYARRLPAVADISDEHPDRGGTGISIIKLK